MNYKPKAADYKKGEVDRLVSTIQKYKVIAIADMTNMPALQLQKMRSTLRNSVLITMSKGRLIKLSIDKLQSKIQGIEELKNYIRGMPALLLTNDSPFKLANVLRKSKSSAPAKGGQTAPNDIVVPAGPTAFPPGPIMGEIGAIGIKCSVVDGKIAIKEDKVVVKEGQIILPEVAKLLTRLGIEPMEIGINLLAAYEKGIIYNKQVLTIDEKEYLSNIKLAYQSTFNLAFNIAFPTKENIKLLVKKAYLDSSGLADSKKIMTSGNVKKILGQANLEAESLKSKLNLDAQSTE
ncbi:MAG TPA: 50S ribosomal protein L10 [Candidatus Nanoarchaeia archaeon]|nr:50S ribosomal protein L10 [Candidatus Nanoarchaeia archaeon]